MTPRLALGIAAVTIALACAACTPMHSTIRPPYEFEGAQYDERQIREIAAQRCEAARQPLPEHPFTTDGCSAWPDDGYRRCCIAHDIRYWCGGSAEARREADAALTACVRGESSRLNARVMWLGVRAGGGRLAPFPWRWGYGHHYPYRSPRDSAATAVGASGQTH
jgi:hypothetical protein